MLASQNVRGRGYRQWQRPLTLAEYSSFVKSALALDPFGWADHSAPSYGAYETMRIFFQAGDRGRSVVLEGPSLEDIVFLDRFRLLAGSPRGDRRRRDEVTRIAPKRSRGRAKDTW